MATLHPFVAYYKEDQELKHLSFVVISECNVHDTVAVHLFIKLFILLYYISNSRAVQKLQELSEFVSPPTRF